MDEQLNNFIYLRIMRNDGHINITKYISKFKRDVQGTAVCDCSNSFSDMNSWEKLHTGKPRK